jgi:hypothetical protein
MVKTLYFLAIMLTAIAMGVTLPCRKYRIFGLDTGNGVSSGGKSCDSSGHLSVYALAENQGSEDGTEWGSTISRTLVALAAI